MQEWKKKIQNIASHLMTWLGWIFAFRLNNEESSQLIFIRSNNQLVLWLELSQTFKLWASNLFKVILSLIIILTRSLIINIGTENNEEIIMSVYNDYWHQQGGNLCMTIIFNGLYPQIHCTYLPFHFIHTIWSPRPPPRTLSF